MKNQSINKKCSKCGEYKCESEFYWRGTLCKKCKAAPALAARAKNRVVKLFGANAGDVVICVTCKNEFTVKKTSPKPRVFCSKKCHVPDAERTLNNLNKMNNLSEEKQKIRNEKASISLTGKSKNGKAAKGIRNHKAKFFEIRSPDMKIYSFKNMAFFVRTHKDLFNDDELKPMGKECYAIIALRGLFALTKNGERKCEFWHGWTIGDKSVLSLKNLKRERDLLGRYK
jgi:endogenous inhibitor of DNA gyrase (YacG/DUF329 family)